MIGSSRRFSVFPFQANCQFALLIQRQAGDFVQIAVVAEKNAHQRETESAEKNQQGRNAEPLNAIDGLEKVFVHCYDG